MKIKWDWNEINNAESLGSEGDEYDWYEEEPTTRHDITRKEEVIIGQFCDQTGLHGKALVKFLERAYEEENK